MVGVGHRLGSDDILFAAWRIWSDAFNPRFTGRPHAGVTRRLHPVGAQRPCRIAIDRRRQPARPYDDNVILRLLHLIKLQTRGTEKLAQTGGRIVVANHPSLLDVVLLMSFIPNAQCIIKHQLWNHRFLGPLMRSAGYIRNDLSPEDMVAVCKASLRRRNCLIIFREGTRSVPGETLRLRRGFANLATLAGAPVQPVTITCDPLTLIKGERWCRLPPRTPLFTIARSICKVTTVRLKAE
jgi:1-acyl-sn-glycerol-3-phosphate acyltransferase